jgi:hypothetical protein
VGAGFYLANFGASVDTKKVRHIRMEETVASTSRRHATRSGENIGD